MKEASIAANSLGESSGLRPRRSAGTSPTPFGGGGMAGSLLTVNLQRELSAIETCVDVASLPVSAVSDRPENWERHAKGGRLVANVKRFTAMMRHAPTDRPILALTYTDGAIATTVLRRLWMRLAAAGATCAGVLQRDEPAGDGTSRCDMMLECLASGQRLKISEDRGEHARGCRLDVGALMRALEIERQMLQAGPDVLIVNKYGKTESEGRGLRPLIAEAMGLAVPVLITVPWRNIESWRLFAGELSIERPAEALAVADEEAVLSEIGLWPRVERPALPTEAADARQQ
jgi:nucleoside-triphosphatase THEP1